jgi:hypothetical protein
VAKGESDYDLASIITSLLHIKREGDEGGERGDAY